jgi:hypothetical protein
LPVASMVSKLTYLAREATPGTRQPPNRYLQGLNLRVVGNNTRGEVRGSGSTMRTARPSIQDWSTFTIAAGSYLDYNSLIYPLSGLLGVPVITTPGGGTLSREHAFAYAADGSNTRPTFTFATGYRGGLAEETIRNVFQSFNLGFSRTAAPTIGGGGYGRNLDLSASLGVNESQTVTITGTPAGGTFTLTYAGQTTAGIAYNAIASAVQTALRALSTIGATGVTVTGGPGPGTPYVATFTGPLANADVALMTADASGLTGGTTPTVTVTETQKGGITTVPVKAVQAPEWDVFMDTTAGGIGVTKVKPYSGAFTFNGLVNPDWVLDSSLPSYDDDVLQVPELSMNMVMRNDSTARALYTALKAGATYYARFKATGPLIETSLNYLVQIDCAVQASENIGQFGDQGGSETMPFPLTIVSDSTLASGGFSALIRNTQTAL